MRKKVIGFTLVCTIFLAFLGAGHLFLGSQEQWIYEVTFAGDRVGFVSSMDEYQEILQDIYYQAEDEWSCSVTMNEEVRATRVSSIVPETTPMAVKSGISQAATYTTNGWALVVDNEVVAFLESKKLAEQALEEVTQHYLDEDKNLVSSSIQEDVSIQEQPIQPALLMEYDSACSVLLSGHEEIHTYTVQRGDTLSGIARSYNTSTSNLRESNPDVEDTALQIGQVLNLETSSAMLHIETVEEEEVEETISRPVQYKANPDMTVRGDVVEQQGSDGRRVTTYRIEKINGAEVKREKISRDVVKEPEPKVVLTGIGQWPARPTGMFRFPLNTGRISSHFGPRGGGFHRGVDIATSRGTPIHAAATGTVVSRGWHSSYGYHVVIQHSNGYSTLYAHATRIADSAQVGSTVVRGSVIAWVGSTGNSTGPHLHWEVRRNGQHINPLNFFN